MSILNKTVDVVYSINADMGTLAIQVEFGSEKNTISSFQLATLNREGLAAFLLSKNCPVDSDVRRHGIRGVTLGCFYDLYYTIDTVAEFFGTQVAFKTLTSFRIFLEKFHRNDSEYKDYTDCWRDVLCTLRVQERV